MPTFLIFRNGAVSDTIRGANASELRSAVLKASATASKLPGAASTAFQTKGRVLGANSGQGQSTGPGFVARAYGSLMNGRIMSTISLFLSLYFVSLFSFDWYAAARGSQYNIQHKKR